MVTLNQLASSTASLLKQPFNHELKERLIDSYKQLIATRIRQSISRHGIDEMLKLSYRDNIEVIDQDYDIVRYAVPGTNPVQYESFFKHFDQWDDEEIEDFSFRTATNIFDPIRFENEAPFTFVGDNYRRKAYPYRSKSCLKYSASLFSTGGSISYYVENKRIYLQAIDNIMLVEAIHKNPSITIESIFYEPEKVLTLYTNDDGLDVAIPMAHDVIASITHELLQKEFGIITPTPLEIKINEKEGTVR
jgi:hypothetical protein